MKKHRIRTTAAGLMALFLLAGCTASLPSETGHVSTIPAPKKTESISITDTANTIAESENPLITAEPSEEAASSAGHTESEQSLAQAADSVPQASESVIPEATKPIEPAKPQPTDSTPTKPKPTEPAPVETEQTPGPTQSPDTSTPTELPTEPPTAPPTEAATDPPTVPPTEPPATETPRSYDLSAVIAYANSYAQNTYGFVPDASLNIGNASYFPGFYGAVSNEQDLYNQAVGNIQYACACFQALGYDLTGMHCNFHARYEEETGMYYLVFLYG